MNKSIKTGKRARRQKRIRATISGTAERPRLSVFKSNKFLYAQLIDDDAGVTLATSSGADATKVGEDLAKRSLAKKISTVVFDRGGYVYRGKVALLAESARKGGLKF